MPNNPILSQGASEESGNEINACRRFLRKTAFLTLMIHLVTVFSLNFEKRAVE